jgi:hypothetical protein
MQLGLNAHVALLCPRAIYGVDISPIILSGKAVAAKDLRVEYA